MIIRLSEEEFRRAIAVGIERRVTALRLKRSNPIGAGPCHWDHDIEGAAAELAVSKYTGLPWYDLADRISALPGDVGHLQVRCTKYDKGQLILHDSDKDNDPFVLVAGISPVLKLAGWAWGKDVKVKGPDKDGKIIKIHWKSDIARPCYMFPQSLLQPLATLPAEKLVANPADNPPPE